MNILSKDGDNVVISASRSDLARLGKLLDWMSDDYKAMDNGMILLEPEEILPPVTKWLDFIDQSIS